MTRGAVIGAGRVAVIGAGPSGLIAAKLLTDIGIRPVIFEAAQASSGLWATQNSRMWNSLRTNLSKFTCSFTSLPWKDDTADFPTKEEVNCYLTNLESQLENIHFSSKVISVVKSPLTNSYEVVWESTPETSSSNIAAETNCAAFDHVIVASGYFGRSGAVATTQSPQQSTKHGDIEFLHSDQYKSPESLAGKCVVVSGGSFSGCEIAAEAAKTAGVVYHVVPHHAYVLPKYLPADATRADSAFLPIDLVFYRLSDAAADRISSILDDDLPQSIEVRIRSADEDAAAHRYFQQLLGPNNDVLKGAHEDGKVRVVISDDYRAMVKMGRIRVVPGRLLSFESRSRMVIQQQRRHSDDTAIAESQSTEELELEMPCDVCITATGYRPNLSYLSADILSALQYDELDTLCPLILHDEMLHPALPGLYFVGMYKGPYFGVMELQAKLVCEYISGARPLPAEDVCRRGLASAADVRHQPIRGHFPHPDYVGMMFDLARQLKLVPSKEFRNQHRYVTPQYFSPCVDHSALHPVEEAVDAFQKGKMIGKAVIQAMEGESWDFRRVIHDRLTGSDSVVEGTVSLARIVDRWEHLHYHERGLLTLPHDKGVFDVSQSYIYTWNAQLDTLDVFFSKVEQPQQVDRPFLSLPLSRGPTGWIATGVHHLCGADNYVASYEFRFDGLALAAFDAVFDVRGPTKDYLSTTHYTLRRP